MKQTIQKAQHVYIESKKNYCSGRPIIVGTKFPVSSVVNYILRQGMTPEELVRDFPHLCLSHVYDALSFYYDHQKEIDQEIEVNSEIFFKKNDKNDK